MIWKQFEFDVTVADTMQCVGSITVPAKTYYIVTATGVYQNSRCNGVVISSSFADYNYNYAVSKRAYEEFFPSCTHSGYTDREITMYFWGEWVDTTRNKMNASCICFPE